MSASRERLVSLDEVRGVVTVIGEALELLTAGSLGEDVSGQLRAQLGEPSSRRERRDLVGEIVRFLAEHPGMSIEAIARGVRARTVAVRRLLEEDDRFVELPRLPGRRGPARCWALAPPGNAPVRDRGTGFSGVDPGGATARSSEPHEG